MDNPQPCIFNICNNTVKPDYPLTRTNFNNERRQMKIYTHLMMWILFYERYRTIRRDHK